MPAARRTDCRTEANPSYNETMRHLRRKFLRGCDSARAPRAAAMSRRRSRRPSRATPSPAKRFEKVRQAAVAGIFYPAERRRLRKRSIASWPRPRPSRSKPPGVVCPHAGYEFSGPTASIGYKQLAGRDISTVILLGPSHYAAFQGAFVSAADAYQTPLGMVPVSPKAAELAKMEPFTANPRCAVDRPAWWPSSPAKAPPPGRDTPETWEHSLGGPIAASCSGRCTISALCRSFSASLSIPAKPPTGSFRSAGCRTIIVVSTDLSHYHPYEEAKTLDTRTVKAICNLPRRSDRRKRLRLRAGVDADRNRPAKGLEGPAAGLSQQRRHGGRQIRSRGLCGHRLLRSQRGGKRRPRRNSPPPSVAFCWNSPGAASRPPSPGNPPPKRRPTFPKSSKPAGRASSR